MLIRENMYFLEERNKLRVIENKRNDRFRGIVMLIIVGNKKEQARLKRREEGDSSRFK